MMIVDHHEALFDHSYLRWFDLRGQPALVEIVQVHDRVEMTLKGGIKCRKPVLDLRLVNGKIENARDDNGKELDGIKSLVLNPTNSGSIAGIHGPKPSLWGGKEIVLFEDKTQLKGQTVPCIRIREAKPQNKS